MTKKELLEIIPLPNAATVNVGLRTATTSELRSLLGDPRASYTGDCQPVTAVALKRQIVTESVGPFRVTGHRAATAAIRAILGTVKAELPDLYGILGTAGMLCARKVRLKGGLGRTPSKHSWGLAVDIKLDGKLDPQGDRKTQRGLLVLARYFNAAGWYWGASFPVEDAMHFEPSITLLREWKKNGTI